MKNLPDNKTKLVCTIGPASDSSEMIEKIISAGMNVARLIFSHGEFATHAEVIKKIRVASKKVGKRVAIMADLPGPKMRIGDFSEEYVTLIRNAYFTLTTEDIIGTVERVSITMQTLPAVVKKDDILFLNDGLIELRVDNVEKNDIRCVVVVGGLLYPRKGLNIPSIDLGTSAFTDRDKVCMQFALENGVDAIAQSFVNSAQDIVDVRQAAESMGFSPFIIAKIERSSVWENIDDILQVTDGIMVARGDLGVEIPIEEIAVAQKSITARANFFGKPVITATQMLESMTANRRPTRAEATDVANAILDGTDCVMLSEESAMGDYPLEAVQMLAKIAAATEPHRLHRHFEFVLKPQVKDYKPTTIDLITVSIENIFARVDSPAAVLAPTSSGLMPRSLTRFRLPVWVMAITTSSKVYHELQFSYGVFPVQVDTIPDDWSVCARGYVNEYELTGSCFIKAEGPSSDNPDINYSMEIIEL